MATFISSGKTNTIQEKMQSTIFEDIPLWNVGWRGHFYDEIPYLSEYPKGMGQFEDENLTAHCQDEGFVFNVEF